MPLCYAYNPVTGEFVGSLEADPSPLEPDVFLYPAFTTTDPPPEPQGGLAFVYGDDGWSTIVDRRGETWWEDGTARIVDFLGDPAGRGLSPDAPPPPPPAPIRVLKSDLWRRATDAEAETIDAALAAQPVRLRNLFRDAAFLSSDDQLFPLLEAGFVAAFGAERAAELLAASS